MNNEPHTAVLDAHTPVLADTGSTAAAVARTLPMLLSLPAFRCWEDEPLGLHQAEAIESCDRQQLMTLAAAALVRLAEME